MRVVVPYVGVPDTRVWDALDATGWPYDPIPVEGSDHAYYDTLAALWADGETFAVVEQDIQIHPTTLADLASCPRDWCGFPYYYGLSLISGLGCAKFSDGLIARYPDAMERVGRMSDAGHPPGHWCRLDSWLNGAVLLDSGEAMRHEHEPMVTHLDTSCSHGCVPT